MKNILMFGLVLASCLTLIACHSKPTTQEQSAITYQQTFQDEHTAENSLDWAGFYRGVLPCADCSGILIGLTLNQDKTYMLQEVYLQGNIKPSITSDNVIKSALFTGTFQFNPEQPSIITLDRQAYTLNRQFFIGEGFAEARAIDGSKIDGQLADQYILKKCENTKMCTITIDE